MSLKPVQSLRLSDRYPQLLKLSCSNHAMLCVLLSKLLVSPLITPIVVPYIIPYITPFKEFRLELMCACGNQPHIETSRCPEEVMGLSFLDGFRV